MMRQLLTIARNTFTESVRQPIFVVLIVVGALALVLGPALAAYTMEDDNKLLVDMGLSTIYFTSVLLAAFTATGVLVSEVENRTVLTVVSKPVPRPVFVVGKYLGVAAAIAIAFFVLCLIFLLTRRHGVLQTVRDPFDGPVLLFGIGGGLIALLIATLGNYLYRWVFTSTFIISLAVSQVVALLLVLVLDKQWALQAPWTDFVAEDYELVKISVGLALIFEAVMLLTAVAIAASTRLGQIMTLVVCVGAFFLGSVSNSFSELVDEQLNLPDQIGIFESFGAVASAEIPLITRGFYLIAKALYLALPNLQFTWLADAITQGHPVTGEYVASVTLYAALYIGVVLCIAVALFQKREVG